MDAEPIYCAEQIAVPVDLADVLKAYTKEVIRRQPEDLVDFSAKYFANLANIANSADEAEAPSREQLASVFERAGGAKSLSAAQLGGLCQQAGIDKGVVARVMDVGDLDPGDVNLDKFLFLLLAMTCESFSAVVSGIFALFGLEIEAQRFHTLISHLAPDMDPDVTTQFLADLSSSLLDVPTVTYDSVCKLEVMSPKLPG
eukprot:gene23601-9130_t